MVTAYDTPLEDADNIKWFNQLMDEQQARYCFYATLALQETPDPHLIFHSDDGG